MELKGQVAIVTGGGRGIGRGISVCLAAEGAQVVIADIETEVAQATTAEIAKLGSKALVVKTDVTKPDQVDALVKTTLDTFGRIDILVNNAGVGAAPGWEPVATPRLADWDACYDVNLKAAVICSNAVIPHMKEKRQGSIVNISSIAGHSGSAVIPQYSASKAACINWTQSLARILGSFNVRVNAVCPGLLWTPLWNQLAEHIRAINPALASLEPREVFLNSVKQSVPLGREQLPEDIGHAVCFLVSDRAKNITGQALNVDGGITA